MGSMWWKPALWATGVVVAVVAAGCGQDAVALPDAAPAVARATWYQDIAPLVAARCASCHSAGGIAPFALTDYEDARAQADRMLHEVERGAMPPFDAREDADCTPRFGWVDDPRLTQGERALLRAWIDDGFALGEVAPVPPPPRSELPGITRSVAPVEGWVTSGDRDQFICYVLDPAVTGAVGWLTGLQVRPDVAEVVHHAVITQVAAGPAQDALVEARGIGRPFDCGTLATPGDFVVHIWTPGNQPMQTPAELAVPIGRGAKLVMQVHYHPAGRVHAADRTAIDLRFSTAWPRKMYFVTAFGNAEAAPALLPGPGDLGPPRFLIPREVADHREHMRLTIPSFGDLRDVRLFSANPHMHLIGTHISATLERPAARGSDPQTECLANGGWNFDWQRTYTYDAPLDQLPSIAPGDVIDIQCGWNNTRDNPFVLRMLRDAGLGAPIDIPLGEQTTNEMCIQIFGVAIDAPPPPAAGEALRLPDLGGLAGMGVNPRLLRNM